MALDSIIREQEAQQPVMVDIPVIVNKTEAEIESEKLQGKGVPWKWIVIGTGIIVFIFLTYLFVRIVPRQSDLEIVAPSGSNKLPRVTLTPSLLESTVSGKLSQIPYSNPLEGFLIFPPEGWVVDDTRMTNTAVVFLNPVTKTIGDKGYATLISVETQRAESVSFTDQVEEIRKGIADTYPDFKFEDDLKLTLQGKPYYLIGGTYFVGEVNMRLRSLVTVYKNKGYAVSASGPVVTWGVNEEVISASLYSFKLL